MPALIAGVALTTFYRRNTERAFDDRLGVYLRAIVADVAIPGDDTRTEPGQLGEPRFELALSGWYWQIKRLDPGKTDVRASRSLWDGGLPQLPDQPGAVASDGKNHARLEEIVRNLDIPPVSKIANDHVLTRTFYLMKGLPGRYVDGEVLVETGSAATDGTSSVIIGANDWASAWAKDANGIALYAAIPGGETQRELAYRAGINMVMYALTGNYKADLVHLPAIMQRLVN